MKEEKILFREWIVMALFLGCLGMLICSSMISQSRAMKCVELSVHQADVKKVLVTISGAVKRPGSYLVPVGSSVREAVKLAGISKDADRKNIPYKRVILGSCEIEVSKKQLNE
jgi:NADH:ubiquinone oxidoreductase subunit F (NADH-binding)